MRTFTCNILKYTLLYICIKQLSFTSSPKENKNDMNYFSVPFQNNIHESVAPTTVQAIPTPHCNLPPFCLLLICVLNA